MKSTLKSPGTSTWRPCQRNHSGQRESTMLRRKMTKVVTKIANVAEAAGITDAHQSVLGSATLRSVIRSASQSASHRIARPAALATLASLPRAANWSVVSPNVQLFVKDIARATTAQLVPHIVASQCASSGVLLLPKTAERFVRILNAHGTVKHRKTAPSPLAR